MSAALIESESRYPGLPRDQGMDRYEREREGAMAALLPLLPGASDVLLAELLRAAYSFGRRDGINHLREDLG